MVKKEKREVVIPGTLWMNHMVHIEAENFLEFMVNLYFNHIKKYSYSIERYLQGKMTFKDESLKTYGRRLT